MAGTLSGASSDPNIAGVLGDNSAGGPAIWGAANPNGRGLVGVSSAGVGAWGHTTTGRGLVGVADTTGAGVWGETKRGTGVVGVSVDGRGLSAGSTSNTGVFGESKTGRGVEGYADTNYGVYGQSRTFPGVRGTSTDGRGIEGWSKTNAGVWGFSDNVGVEATGGKTGLVARGPVNAAYFEGNVTVTGDVILVGADVAEQFDVAPETVVGQDPAVGPGTVVVLDAHGRLAASDQPYDTRVAGIVSGAGDRVPALVLDRPAEPGTEWRVPLAVVGKAWCQADARNRPICVGDLLTTSTARGHAMSIAPGRAVLGAVIGKALTPLPTGTGSVLVLVGLG